MQLILMITCKYCHDSYIGNQGFSHHLGSCHDRKLVLAKRDFDQGYQKAIADMQKKNNTSGGSATLEPLTLDEMVHLVMTSPPTEQPKQQAQTSFTFESPIPPLSARAMVDLLVSTEQPKTTGFSFSTPTERPKTSSLERLREMSKANVKLFEELKSKNFLFPSTPASTQPAPKKFKLEPTHGVTEEMLRNVKLRKPKLEQAKIVIGKIFQGFLTDTKNWIQYRNTIGQTAPWQVYIEEMKKLLSDVYYDDGITWLAHYEQLIGFIFDPLQKSLTIYDERVGKLCNECDQKQINLLVKEMADDTLCQLETLFPEFSF